VMEVSNDPGVAGDTISPFHIGCHPDFGCEVIWGLVDGINHATPLVTLPRLYVFEPVPCDYIPGDINDNGEPNGVDITFAVNYLKGYGAPPPVICLNCPAPQTNLFGAGDVNGNCQFNGVDITYFVNYLKGLAPSLSYCPICPPQ